MKIRRANLFSSKNKNQDPVVQRVISTNPELNLNLNPGFFISLFNSLLGKFSLFFLEHPMIKLQAKRFDLNFLLKLSDLKSNSTLALGYLNLALDNPGQVIIMLQLAT